MYALGLLRSCLIFIQEPRQGKTRSHSFMASMITFLALSRTEKEEVTANNNY